MALELLLLGTPLIRFHGQPLELPVRKAAGLLAYLALEGPTPRSRLAGLLWDDGDEARARTNLRQLLRRVRSAVPEALIETQDELLCLSPEVAVDALEFAALLDVGEREAALATYRGDFLSHTDWPASPDFEDWAQAQREQLSLRWQAAMTQQAADWEAQGEYARALQAHLRLLQTDELQEARHCAVMRLYSLLGERGAALKQFERCRQVLSAELGLTPLPHTLQIAEQLRRGDLEQSHLAQALSPPLSAPLSVTALELPFVAREAAWRAVTRLQVPLVLLTGEPGVGKTRLLEELARSRGRYWVVHAQELTQFTPLAPLLPLLRSLLAESGWPLSQAARRELARLLPEVSGGATTPAASASSASQSSPLLSQPLLDPLAPSPLALSQITPSQIAPNAAERTRFVEVLSEAVLLLFESPHPANPLITLLIDDAHWLDATTLEVIGNLAQRLRDQPLRLLVSARAFELSERPHAHAAFAALEKSGLARQLRLEPWSETDLLSLIRTVSGSRRGEYFTQRLHEATGGNPLFVQETLRGLIEGGSLWQDAAGGWHTVYDSVNPTYEDMPLSITVRGALLERLERLGPSARRLLDAASLAGEVFAAEDLAQTTALDEWTSLELLERAEQAGLLRADPLGYRFGHELVRRVLDDELRPSRRRLLHRRLAATLQRRGSPPARIAQHLQAAGENREALAWWRTAAADAKRVYAYREALTHYAQALALTKDARERCGLLSERITLWRILNEQAGWQQDAGEMLQLAERLGDLTLRAEAATKLARLTFRTGNNAEAVTRMEEVLSWVGVPDELRAEAYLIAGMAAKQWGRLAWAQEQLHLGLECNPPNDLSRAGILHLTLAECQAESGDLPSARVSIQQSVEVMTQASDIDGQIRAKFILGWILRLSGETQQALTAWKWVRTQASAVGMTFIQIEVLLQLLGLYLQEGEAESSLELWQEIENFSKLTEPRIAARKKYYWHLYYLLMGNLGEALRNLLQALELTNQENLKSQAAHFSLVLSQFWLRLADLEAAEQNLSLNTQLIKNLQFDSYRLFEYTIQAKLNLFRGDSTQALRCLESGERWHSLAERSEQTLADLTRGEVFFALGRFSEAEEILATIGPSTAPSLRADALALQLWQPDPPAALIPEAQALLSSRRLNALTALRLQFALARLPDAAPELHLRARDSLATLAQTLTPTQAQRFTAFYLAQLPPE
ncbi:ATP-binding protein [Deinococcus psychrotolerans]|nr:AAA family ATPase [Deinococcus psychrotolerans]